MASLGQKFTKYRDNARMIRRFYGNPLKRIDQIELKDRLEKEFYDKEADKFLSEFDEKKFTYDENEPMPRSHLFLYSLLKDLSGKRVLDCCCGHGIASVRCARRGAMVTGIDISPRMLELSRRNCVLNGVLDRVDLQLVSVQEMTYPDNTFDYVIGLGALHHLNLELAGREISRVLKPSGRAIFLEPRIPLRLLMMMRSLFPNPCLESPGGGGLTDRDIAYFGSFFASHRVDYFFFLRKLARFPIVARYADGLDRWDDRLINTFPFLRKLYWAFVLQFVK